MDKEKGHGPRARHRRAKSLLLLLLLVSKYAIRRNCFVGLYLWCEGQFLEINPNHPPPPPPTNTHTLLSPSRCTPPPRSAHLTPPSIKLKLASLRHRLSVKGESPPPLPPPTTIIIIIILKREKTTSENNFIVKQIILVFN